MFNFAQVADILLQDRFSVSTSPQEPYIEPVRLAPAVTLSSSPKRGTSLQTKQLWDGTVTQVDNSGFSAVLIDKTNPENPDEEVTFEFGEVQPDDLRLVVPGSVFYWTVGSEKTPGGQIRTVSFLQFRRIPTWTNAAVGQVADRVQLLKGVLGLDCE